MNTASTHRRYFPRGPGLGLKTFVLAVCALTLIFADHYSHNLRPVRATLSWLLSPALWVAALPHNLVGAAGEVKSRETLERENRDLRQKQLMLAVKLEKFDALAAENQRIRELLASSGTLKERVLIASIIAVNQDPYRHQITLNRGSRDGVYRGQALIDAHGILGQVIEVAPATSQALLITDPDHGIPVEVNRTGLQTIALGRGDGQGLTLPFLPSNADIQPGDLLVSSALGGRFPAGYPVGKIYSVRHNAGEHFMEAVAYPSAHLNQGNQALLVWNETTDATIPALAAAGTAPSVPLLAPASALPTLPAPPTVPMPDATPLAVTAPAAKSGLHAQSAEHR
ncbi:MAG: rod shape-determining protein MreC [Stenotrophobium sp.]